MKRNYKEYTVADTFRLIARIVRREAQGFEHISRAGFIEYNAPAESMLYLADALENEANVAEKQRTGKRR